MRIPHCLYRPNSKSKHHSLGRYNIFTITVLVTPSKAPLFHANVEYKVIDHPVCRICYAPAGCTQSNTAWRHLQNHHHRNPRTTSGHLRHRNLDFDHHSLDRLHHNTLMHLDRFSASISLQSVESSTYPEG